MKYGFLLLVAACASPAHPVASAPGFESGEAALAEARTPADVQRLCDRSKQTLTSLVERAASANERELVRTLQDFDRVITLAEYTAAVIAENHPDAKLRGAAQACLAALDPLSTQLASGPAIAHLAALHDLPAAEQRYADRVVANAKLSGAGLSPSATAELTKLQARESALQAAMNETQNAQRPPIVVERARLAGMPESFVTAHSPDAAGTIELDAFADYRDVATYANDRALASELLAAQRLPAASSAPQLRELLEVRKQIATTLGCPSYAACRAKTRMVGTPARTEAFYRELLAALAEPDATYRAALHLPAERPPETDLRFLERQLRERIGIDDPTPWLSYFEVDPTVDRILAAVGDAMGLRFVPATAQAWSPDVRVFDVLDATGARRGRFFFDLYMRAPKSPGGGSTYAFVAHTPGHTTEPVSVAIVLALPRAQSGPTVFRSAAQLSVFMHELGHAIDFLYETQSALAPPEFDYFDVISQLFEYWSTEPGLLQRLGEKDGKPLPPQGARALSTELMWADWGFVRYVTELGLLDLAYHGDAVPADLLAPYVDAHQKLFPTRLIQDNHPECSLAIPTLVYSGNGHALPWGLAIATDLAGQFHDFSDRATWSRLVTQVLSADGPAEARIDRFLGRPWNLDRLRARIAPPLSK